MFSTFFFHDFGLVSFCSASPAFFRIFFFRPSLLLVAARARFCAVTGGGHYSTSRGVAYPLGPYSPTPSSPIPAFIAPASARSRVLNARIRFRHRCTQSPPSTKSRKPRYFISEREDKTRRNEQSMTTKMSAPPPPTMTATNPSIPRPIPRS